MPENGRFFTFSENLPIIGRNLRIFAQKTVFEIFANHENPPMIGRLSESETEIFQAFWGHGVLGNFRVKTERILYIFCEFSAR